MTIRKRMTTVICLIIIIIMCLIGAISNFSYKSVIANASTIETFVGTSGSPSGANLYNATNTYNYNGVNNILDVSAKSSYKYYNTDIGYKNSNSVYLGAPQITVLTHGLGGDASHWSNDAYGFAHDEDSLFMRLDEELSKNGGNGAHLYWAKMDSLNRFYLYDLNSLPDGEVIYDTDSLTKVTSITDSTKHFIIVFEAYAKNGYNYQVYEEFNYMLSKIVYDVKCLNGGALPKINLIGHSRGGLTNLQYALDHPDMVASMFSLGTPFFGSDTASTSLGAEFAPGNGRLDIINRSMFVGYHERWIDDYDRLYSNINAHALGGYSDSDFVLDALIESNDTEIEGKVSDEWFQVAKWAIKILGGAVNSLNTTAELVDFAASFFRDIDYTQSELESIIQIIADIQYISVDDNNDFWGNLWDNIKHNIPIVGCPYFMNDLLVDLSSQLGHDEHGDTYRSYGFETFSKCFKSSDYSEDNPAMLSMSNMPAIVHNLEARDDDFINYILSNISLGNNDSRFLYDKTSDTTATVYGYSGEILTDTIEIPDHIDGLTINAVAGNLFVNKGNIVSIILPTTLKTIGDYTFAGLENLTTISFAGSGTSQLEKIGYGAFAGCENLTKFNSANNGTLDMPTNVEFVDCYAFYGTGFTTIELGANIDYIGDIAFSNIAGLTSISVSGNSKYFSNGGALFNSDGWLMQYPVGKSDTSYEIPSSVSNVDIRHISQFAFMGENNLETINLNNVISIDSYAFKGCTSLATFNNATNVEYVGPFALDDTQIMLGTHDFITLGKVLYKYNGTASVLNANDFPTGLTRISSNVFCCNDSIEKIYLPNNIIDIDNNAFVDCANLEEIIYYNAMLPDIGAYSFVSLPNTFKFNCRKGLIDSLGATSNWYNQSNMLSPIATEVYFEDIDKHVTFYYGEDVVLPTEEIPGLYIKGWLRVNESTNQTYGNYLTPSTWNETALNAMYRADTVIVENYTLNFYNGNTQIGAFNISTGDEFSITQTGYTINGVTYTFTNSEAMLNCSFGDYYGLPIINNVTVATFEGWFLNGVLLSSSGVWENYDTPILNVYSVWTPVNFSVVLNDGYSGSTLQENINYFDGIILPSLSRDGYEFKGWETSDGYLYQGGTTINPIGDIVLTGIWEELFEVRLVSSEHSNYDRTWEGTMGETFTLPSLTSGYYYVCQWGTYQVGVEYTIIGDATLYAVWKGNTYTITYCNLTFMGQTAEVIWDDNLYLEAPSSYEYGVGLDLSRASAFWQAATPYDAQLVFMGWYTNMDFTKMETNISANTAGDKTYYAKWRYDLKQITRYEDYTITDDDPYADSYDRISLELGYNNLLVELKNIGINYIYLEFKLKIEEVNDGYQEVLLYKDSTDEILLWSVTDIDHTVGADGQQSKYYLWHLVFDIGQIALDEEYNAEEVQVIKYHYIYVRYGAHGGGADTWTAQELQIDVMYTVGDDCEKYIEEFSWDASSVIDDSACVPLENASESFANS